MAGVLRSGLLRDRMGKRPLGIVRRWRFSTDRAVHGGPADADQLGQFGVGVDASRVERLSQHSRLPTIELLLAGHDDWAGCRFD